MKRIGLNILLLFGTLAGLMLLFFPHISFRLASKNQSYLARQYDEQLVQMGDAELQDALASARLYNERLLGDSIEDPFLAGSGKILPENYLLQLNVNGTMGHVKIPKIDLDLPIYHGTSDETLRKGAGHLEGTSLPVGGHGTHTVITGHTGLSSAKMFTDLSFLEEGDEFYLCILGETLAYRVDQIKVVEPNNIDELKPLADGEYATLITCTPYGINSHRLLVRGARTSYTPQQIAAQTQTSQQSLGKESILLIASLAALAVLLVLTLIITHKTRRAIRHRLRVAHARQYYAAPKIIWRNSAAQYHRPKHKHP